MKIRKEVVSSLGLSFRKEGSAFCSHFITHDPGFGEFYIKSHLHCLFLDREFLQVCLLQPAHVL